MTSYTSNKSDLFNFFDRWFTMTENEAVVDSSQPRSLENDILLYCENKSENLFLESSNVDGCFPQHNGRSSSDSFDSELSELENALNTNVKAHLVYNSTETVTSTSENIFWPVNSVNSTLNKGNVIQGTKEVKGNTCETGNNILVQQVAQKRPRHTNNYLIKPNETSNRNSDVLKTIFDQVESRYEHFNKAMDIKDKRKCCDSNEISLKNTLLSPAITMPKFNKLSNISKWNSIFEGSDLDFTPSKKGLLRSEILTSSPNLLVSGVACTSTPYKGTNKEPPALAILKQLRPSSVASREGTSSNSNLNLVDNELKLDCSHNELADIKIYTSCLELYHRDVLAEHANDNLKFEETFSQISEYLNDMDSLCNVDEDKTLMNNDVTIQHVHVESTNSRMSESKLITTMVVDGSQVSHRNISSLARESDSAAKQHHSTIISDEFLELDADENIFSKSVESANKDDLFKMVNEKYTASDNVKNKMFRPREVPEKNQFSTHSITIKERVPQYGNEAMKNVLKEDNATINTLVQCDNNLYHSVTQSNNNIVDNITEQKLDIKRVNELEKVISVPTSFKYEQMVAGIKMPSIEKVVQNNSIGEVMGDQRLLDKEINVQSGQNSNMTVVSVNVLDISASSMYKSILYATEQHMILDESEILGVGEIKHEIKKDVSMMKVPSTISRLKELEEFVSDDPKENEDNYNPEWEFLRRLSTDEERYKAVRIRWRNLLIPNPKENLTCRVWRRENNLPSLSKNKNINSSESTPQSYITPCTTLYDNDIDAAIKALEKRRLKLRKDHKIALEKLAEVQSWEQGDLARQYPYGRVPQYRWRQLHERQLEAVRQQQQKYNDRLSQEERTAQSTIKTLQSACKEVFAFHSYYEGLDASNNVNAMFLTDGEVEELVETEDMLSHYQLIYNGAQ